METKYLKIKNKGEIEEEGLFLIGASTKVGDISKIGEFGSGNKYAIAKILRDNISLNIFSGEKEIQLSLSKTSLRGISYDVLVVNGLKTSITTSMGKDWELWMALREIYANAIDEGGHEMYIVEDVTPIMGETHFYIGLSDDVRIFHDCFNSFFSEKRKVLYKNDEIKILEKDPKCKGIRLYRKGILCYQDEKMESVFDYDFNNIEITEDRIMKYMFQARELIWRNIISCDNKEVIKRMIVGCYRAFEGVFETYYTITITPSVEFISVINEINLAPIEQAGLLDAEEQGKFALIPLKIYGLIITYINADRFAKKFNITKRGGIFKVVKDMTDLQKETMKTVLGYIKFAELNVPYQIEVAVFVNKNVLGCAYNDVIYLSDIVLGKSIQEIVGCVIEEMVHIKYDVSDETRAFQTAVIEEFVSYIDSKINK